MTAENLFGSILFSAIGMGAFVYGKRNALWKPLILGVVLMVYPYFIGETWMMFTAGTALTTALFVFRD
ncbi:MAG: hypothetical protein PHC88_13735 [Terrimicrobiaceae bacterium]|nr:hypothetical protein [Terrimicrobiaceae bacterium]